MKSLLCIHVKWWLVNNVLLLSWVFSRWKFCGCPSEKTLPAAHSRFSSLRIFQTRWQEKICWISQQLRSQLGRGSSRTGVCATVWTEKAAALSAAGVLVWHLHGSSALSRLMKGCEDPIKKMRWCISRGFILYKSASVAKDCTNCDRRFGSSAHGRADLGRLFSSSLLLCLLQRLFYQGKTILFGF